MKTNKTNFDVDKRDFYNKVRERKDELSAVLYAANLEGYGFKDFNEWYTQEYDWRFLRDILGERDKKGNPWDYNTLVHLPVWTWTDAEGTEHRQVIKGEVKPDDLGLGITSMTAGDGIKIEETADSDEHITFTVSDNMVDSDTIEVSRDNDGTLLVPNYVTRVNVKEGLYSKVTPSTSAAQDVDTIQSVEIDGTKYNFPGSSGSLVTKTYVDQQDAAVLSNAKDYTDSVYSKKVDKITTTGYGAYGHDGSTQKEWIIDANPTAQTIAYRTTDGRLRVGTPNEDNDAINKSYIETNYYDKDAVDLKIATETGLYIGYMEDSTITSEDDFAPNTWIPNNWDTFFPSKEISSVSNNDYVWVFLTKLVDTEGKSYEAYYRCKMTVDSSTGTEVKEWKTDLTVYSYDLQLIDEIKELKEKVSAHETKIDSNTKDISTLTDSKQNKVYYTDDEPEDAVDGDLWAKEGEIESDLFDQIYPIGSIYLSINSDMPDTFKGTWEKITDGTFLMSANGTTTIGATGGSADAIVVSHTHTNSVTTNGAHTHTRGSMDITGGLGHALVPVGRDEGWPYKTGCFSDSTTYPWGYDSNGSGTAWGGKEIVFKASNNWSGSTSEAGGHTHTVTIDSNGSDGTNANLPPYLAVSMWKRTA